jgi:hypothetical protein
VKRIVSVSLGSSSRDHRARDRIARAKRIDLERVGMDGSIDRAMRETARTRRNGRRDRARRNRRLPLRRHRSASRCATACACSKRSKPRPSSTAAAQEYARARTPFATCATNSASICGHEGADGQRARPFRHGAGARRRGRRRLFGDFIFALDLDKPVRGLAEFEAPGRALSCPMRASCRFSSSIRPGKKQDRPPQPKYPEYYAEAEIIAGDFHFMRQFMPDRLDGKTRA